MASNKCGQNSAHCEVHVANFGEDNNSRNSMKPKTETTSNTVTCSHTQNIKIETYESPSISVQYQNNYSRRNEVENPTISRNPNKNFTQNLHGVHTENTPTPTKVSDLTKQYNQRNDIRDKSESNRTTNSRVSNTSQNSQPNSQTYKSSNRSFNRHESQSRETHSRDTSISTTSNQVSPQFTESLPNRMIYTDEPLILEAHFEGYPEPRVYWQCTPDNQIINKAQMIAVGGRARIRLQTNSLEPGDSTARLELWFIFTDFGWYPKWFGQVGSSYTCVRKASKVVHEYID